MKGHGQVQVRLAPYLWALPIQWRVRVGDAWSVPNDLIITPSGPAQVTIEAKLTLPDLWALGQLSLAVEVEPGGAYLYYSAAFKFV